MEPNPMCEICGEPATVLLNDTVEIHNHVTGWITNRLAGKHLFCDAHKREPQVLDKEEIFSPDPPSPAQ